MQAALPFINVFAPAHDLASLRALEPHLVYKTERCSACIGRMEELFEDIEKLASAEKRVAMATLVATRGTSPKREGAKMWVGEEGRILGSVTIGGCVDARVIAESEKVLSSFEPRLVEMKLADEDAWEIGFSCAGDLDVLIEPLDLTNPVGSLLDSYRAIRNAVDQGKHAVLVTSLKDSSSQVAGIREW